MDTVTDMDTGSPDHSALYRLLTWTSPAYPTGAFSYSHGLEWAVETGAVRDVATMLEYILAVLEDGGGWVDAVLFVQAWRAASATETQWQQQARQALQELVELAVAFRATAETHLESRQQGTAFLNVTLEAWPHPRLREFAADLKGAAVAHCVAMAVTCAIHAVPLEAGLRALLQGLGANLISAGTRLIPLGQTQSQIAVARLEPHLAAIAHRAQATSLDDLGTATPGLELCSMLHETQYTRLFRS